MLNFFRINDPYRLIFIFIILVSFRVLIGYFGVPLPLCGMKWVLLGERLADGNTMYSEAYDFTAPFSAIAYRGMYHLFGRSMFSHYILSTIVIIVQAGILNHIFIKNRAFNESNFLVAFFYVMLSLAIPDFFLLSPQLMSMTFILLALNNVFRRIDNEITDQLFLNAGIFLGIASLFYLPSIVYFVVFLIALIVFANAIFRRLLLYIYGLLVPFIFIFCYYFWKDAHMEFMSSFLVRGLFADSYLEFTFMDLVWISVPIVFWLFLALIATFTLRGMANFQIKIRQVMLFSLLAGAFGVIVDVHVSTVHLILFLPATSYFLTHFILSLKREWTKHSIPALLLLSILFIPFYSYFRYADLMDYNLEQQPSKGLMLIGTDLDYYSDYQIKSPYIDSLITNEARSDLSYYEAAEKTYIIYKKSDPDVIIDNLDMMEQIEYRFPTFVEDYVQDGNRYIKRTNN